MNEQSTEDRLYMNGRWLVWFKITLVILPVALTLLFAWAAWLTAEQFSDRAFRQAGPRYTSLDAEALELRLKTEIARLPPQDWQQRIRDLEANQVRILTILERVEKSIVDKDSRK